MEKKVVTLRQVAEKAGVSMTSASIILNRSGNYKSMSPKTRDKVIQAAEELGYYPNYFAKVLRQQSTMQIGLILPNITNQFMTPLIMGCTEAANRAGYNLNLIDMYGKNNEEMRENVQFLKQTGMVDGLIINAVGEIVSEAVGDFPAVYIDSKGLLPSVTFTEKKSIYDLTTLFLRQGLRRIAYIGGEETRTAYVLREQGYRDAMRDYGLEVDERYIHNVRMHLWAAGMPTTGSVPCRSFPRRSFA